MKMTGEFNSTLLGVGLKDLQKAFTFGDNALAFRTVRISPRAVRTLIGGVRLEAVDRTVKRDLLRPELPAEITLKPYGDPRNVMISR